MARGWESKSVESQREEAKVASPRAAPLTEDQLEVNRKRQSLMLSRTRVLNDIESSSNPRYKESLTQALKFLDEQLAKLENPGKKGK